MPTWSGTGALRHRRGPLIRDDFVIFAFIGRCARYGNADTQAWIREINSDMEILRFARKTEGLRNRQLCRHFHYFLQRQTLLEYFTKHYGLSIRGYNLLAANTGLLYHHEIWWKDRVGVDCIATLKKICLVPDLLYTVLSDNEIPSPLLIVVKFSIKMTGLECTY